MNSVYLLTGGNIGDRMSNLANARKLIGKHVGAVVQSSSLYETAAWGVTEQPAFLNQVLHVQTTKTAEEVLHEILSIEKQLGRIRTEKMGPRTIDIDILMYNNLVLNTPSLVIPHAQMLHRRFVLTPLAEIAGDVIHPVANTTITHLLHACTDHLPVHKIPIENR